MSYILKPTIFGLTMAASVSLSLVEAAYAQGGNDPISGIDMIIKEDPGSRPIRPLSLSTREIKQLNKLKGNARPKFLAKVITPRLAKISERAEASINWNKELQQGLSDHWCGPCKMATSFTLISKSKDPEVTYKVNFNIRFDTRTERSKAPNAEAKSAIKVKTKSQ